MGVRLAGLVVAMCVVWPRSVAAEPDNRPGDRFFFGLQAGAASSSADRVAGPDLGSAGLSFGYETSYWPNDYLGFGLDFHYVSVPAAEQRPAGTNVDLGLPLVAGVPLRYVQPYVGLWLGLAHTYVDAGGTGVRLAATPVAGLNGYINRNLRLYLQWQSVSLGYDGADAHAPMVVVGARWSPDFFHSTRPTWKFQTVWWSVLGTLVAWGATSLAVGD